MGIDLEHALFICGANQVKLAVLGWARACAESGIKDIALIGPCLFRVGSCILGGNGGNQRTEAGEFFSVQVKTRSRGGMEVQPGLSLQLYRGGSLLPWKRTVHYLCTAVGLDTSRKVCWKKCPKRRKPCMSALCFPVVRTGPLERAHREGKTDKANSAALRVKELPRWPMNMAGISVRCERHSPHLAHR